MFNQVDYVSGLTDHSANSSSTVQYYIITYYLDYDAW